MIARDVMTTDVVTVGLETSVREIAQRLLERRISAVPVTDAEGRMVGIVSEGDLVRRSEIGTEARPAWWLMLLASPENLAERYRKAHGRRAADVMTREVVTVDENTPVNEIARQLEERRIKRVPVVRDGRPVGIVSRADLVRGLAAVPVVPDVPAEDATIRERCLEILRMADLASPGLVNVIVTDGVIHLWGVVSTEAEREALRVAAENTPGARSVTAHIGIVPAHAMGL